MYSRALRVLVCLTYGLMNCLAMHSCMCQLPLHPSLLVAALGPFATHWAMPYKQNSPAKCRGQCRRAVRRLCDRRWRALEQACDAAQAGVCRAERVQQDFEGWGTSLAWFANIVGRFPDPLRSHLADLLFDAKVCQLSCASTAVHAITLTGVRLHLIKRALARYT